MSQDCTGQAATPAPLVVVSWPARFVRAFGQLVAGGAGLDDLPGEGEPVDYGRAQPRVGERSWSIQLGFAQVRLVGRPAWGWL